MRRVLLSITVLSVAMVMAPTPASGVAQPGGCPPTTSGWTLYPIVGQPGDPAPQPGIEPLWDIAEEGVLAEGYTSLEDFVEQVGPIDGFASVDELYTLALEGWMNFDVNDDSAVCVRSLPPSQDTYPAYIFLFNDNKVRSGS